MKRKNKCQGGKRGSQESESWQEGETPKDPETRQSASANPDAGRFRLWSSG